MKSRTLSRIMLAATLFAAIPFASVASAPIQQAKALVNLQTRGTTEINRRLTSLSNALTQLTSSTKLTPTSKTALTAEITAESASLTTLQTKLAADTDLVTARSDVQSIMSNYLVYALVLPQVRLVAVADRFTAVEDQLLTLQTKLQSKITAAKATGTDTATMDASLADLGVKIAIAKTATDRLALNVLSINPNDYNTSHRVLASYRQSLVAAQAAIKAARTDVATIITDLRTSK